MAQPPPNYGYMQQQQPPMQQQQQNGNYQQNLVNGFPPSSGLPPMKPTQIPSQQLPPQQAINYQNFQTKAIQPGAGTNGSNSALSSRTSSPGVQQSSIPQSQLPPSRSYPSMQLYGTVPQQQVMPPSSQLPMAPMTNSNNNSIIGDLKANFTPNSPINSAIPSMPPGGPMTAQQQQLSTSMNNLSLNPGPPGTFPNLPMPSSKSDQNFLNNNNAPGITSNFSMPQMQPKPINSNMAKRPMYPAQQNAQQPLAPPQFQQQQQQQQFQQQQQPQAFNSFPANPMSQPGLQTQAPQVRGNLQYQNFPQTQPQIQQQQPQPTVQSPGSIVSQGFNRMWGNETIDLMQNRHILPQTKVLPPVVKLNHQFHEATNCSTDIFRCTLTKIPESNSLLQKSRLPLGILIHPYRDLSVRPNIL